MIKIEQPSTEAAGYALLERLRWAGCISCPHCAAEGPHIFITPADGRSRKTRTGTASQRRVWKCSRCRMQFSALTGTVLERTKVPIRTWVAVVTEWCSRPLTAYTIARDHPVTYKTARHMLHLIEGALVIRDRDRN